MIAGFNEMAAKAELSKKKQDHSDSNVHLKICLVDIVSPHLEAKLEKLKPTKKTPVLRIPKTGVNIAPYVFFFQGTSTLSSVDQPLIVSLDLCVTDRSVVPVRRVLLFKTTLFIVVYDNCVKNFNINE